MMVGNPERLPTTKLESALYGFGVQHIAGIDEAGRGAWAGPVTAAAVVLPPPGPDLEKQLDGLHDSKCLSPSQREHWDRQVRQIARNVSIGEASVEEIDQIGILPATRLAMQRAVQDLGFVAHHLLIDYILIGDMGINQTAIPHGDSLTLSIAAASVVAKVARDRFMEELDRLYPRFGFARHKGYGTRQHQSALELFGPCPLHRRSFAPTKRALGLL